MQSFLDSEGAKQLINFHMPRYEELPSLELYMDQLLSVIDDVLHPLFSSGSRSVLTPTMINNYVKQRLVEPPVKKRYGRDQLAYFLVVALLKSVFSIAEISELIKRQYSLAGTDRAYNRFCRELEFALKIVMGTESSQEPLPPEGSADLLRAAVKSIVNKVYVEKYLEFSYLSAGNEENE